ncbi:E3 ubiquitin-protein ligase RNF19B-like protein [Leptotrombidium deliense]|uniref:RBR-type E3 ubiquitin transferase n=1 Tax=Leptotrombidium deliense TaxID=299467 RepID=A0A443SVU3_9ACAR|nr:E3 ubiquitin-protein ligase RNF19B-like protein [Leptotrombidium deliense]
MLLPISVNSQFANNCEQRETSVNTNVAKRNELNYWQNKVKVQQTTTAVVHQQDVEEEEDFFKDMTPAFKRQKKLLVGKNEGREDLPVSNRLDVDYRATITTSSELGLIDENTYNGSWEEEAVSGDIMDVEEALRDARQAERERRLAEHKRIKMEKELKKMKSQRSRFSLRRFLNPSSYSRTATLNNKRSSNHTDSESASTADNKSVSNVKATSFCPTYSSLDFESTSISSGRSDFIQAGASGFLRYSSALESVCVMECPLCLLQLPIEYFPELATCSHRACYDCMQKYLKIEICESRVNITCPECTEPIHPNDIRAILNDEKLMSKYESFMLRRVLVAEPDARWCPAPDCGYVVVAAGCASCPELKCGRAGCGTSFCYHCKQEWHPNQTCDAARAQRNHSMPFSQNPMTSSLTFSRDSITQRDDIKPCPCCKVLVIKMDDGSCNHMTCCVCGTEFCWLCMKEISDLHYLSPSGCTFWGKKPWSRKKKILWQLGMLVGAPVGIALIAGIAVPAIIIGIPVWVGRKLHARFEKNSMSKHKKNLLITSGVLTSILVSPILATVAVGIGVPILLAYVYGVVPISLCRSGGCGVSTSPSGVRIEMDEENEIGLNTNAAPGNSKVLVDDSNIELSLDGLSVDTALSNKGVNPSIGEVSFDMSSSISMGSGTHLDRVGADRESASNAALAGSIASANTHS